jgi:hypothetical protein
VSSYQYFHPPRPELLVAVRGGHTSPTVQSDPEFSKELARLRDAAQSA